MLQEDLSAFFKVDEHAVEARLDWLPVRGIFNRPYNEPFAGVASSAPTFTLASSDCEGVCTSSRLILDDTTWRVRSVQTDGTGITVLELELQ